MSESNSEEGSSSVSGRMGVYSDASGSELSGGEPDDNLDFSGWNCMPPRDWAPPESEGEPDVSVWGMRFECAGLPRDLAEVVDDADGLFD